MREKAVSYLRVSGKAQIDGDGFVRQRKAITAYARRAKLDLVDEYRDEGVSGCNELSHRPGLAALLDRIESNGVRIVIVERADRMARDLLVGEVILNQFRLAGVAVWDTTGNNLTENSDPTAVLIRQILGAVSEFDKSVLVHKLRAARERKRAKTGRCEGRKPYGFRPGEASIIAIMKRMRRKPRGAGKRAMSYAKIAEQLNTEGLSTRKGGKWSTVVVRRILTRKAV